MLQPAPGHCRLQGFMHMTKSGGVREWFKGNGTNCIRIVPNSAVKFATYQELSRCALVEPLRHAQNQGTREQTPRAGFLLVHVVHPNQAPHTCSACVCRVHTRLSTRTILFQFSPHINFEQTA